MINEIYDYIDSDLRVFGLYGLDKAGNCECENKDCTALYKHPRISNWQHTPAWSDEQIEVMSESDQFKTGFGVLCSGLLVVDVDPRNGGNESYKKLTALAGDLVAASGFVVHTGGGGQHIYFKAPENIALSSHLIDYPGIDFKSSGYVVGAGSLHASGFLYEAEKGFTQNICIAPDELINLLTKKEHYRATVNGNQIDVTETQIKDLLSHVSPDCNYETWIRSGMAVHHAMSGDGLPLWDEWSSGGKNYPGISNLEHHWHSFGKSSNPVGLGTLIHYAEQGGYSAPVTFEFTDNAVAEATEGIDITGIDITRPPGFVGELTAWINSQCLYPREHLAVASALTAIGNIAGLRYYDEQDGMTSNLFAFCVAGASTGKEAVQQAYSEIMRAAGLSPAVHGNFKSEQELIRNLTRHQAAYYLVDEFGLVLRKLKNASAKGGAPYLEGLVGLIMSVYGKANGFLAVTGDIKEELKQQISKEIAQCRKAIEANEDASGKLVRKLEQLERATINIENGIEKPFLSIIGYTTPVTFNELVDFEQATNGFLARALIFNELETNPKRRKNFKREPMPTAMESTLQMLYKPGTYSMEHGQRIEHYGDKTPLPTSPGASTVLDQVYNEFWSLAETHKNKSGLESIPRRGYELCAKISLILAIPEGLRTVEHVRWAYAIAKRDVENKTLLAKSNEDDKLNNDALAAKIMGLVSKDHGETRGAIRNRCRRHNKESIDSTINLLVDKNLLRVVLDVHPANKKEIERFFLG